MGILNTFVFNFLPTSIEFAHPYFSASIICSSVILSDQDVHLFKSLLLQDIFSSSISLLTELTRRCKRVHQVDFIGLWNQREPCSWPLSGVRQQCRGSGEAGATLWTLRMDRQGTVNLEDQEPEFFVFTSLLLQVMSPRCKKIQFSVAQSLWYYLRE